MSEYLRGAGRLTREQWQSLREAVDLLAHSTVTFQERAYTFARFYDTFIDLQFAEPFLQALVAMPKPLVTDLLFVLVVGLCGGLYV